LHEIGFERSNQCDTMSFMNFDGRKRVVIENVKPEIDGGRFPAKRVVGENVRVTADVFTDGHDKVAAVIRYRGPSDEEWHEKRCRFNGADRATAEFQVTDLGPYLYTVEGWVDHFASWQSDLKKKYDAGQTVNTEVKAGILLVREATKRAEPGDAKRLSSLAASIEREKDADRAVALCFGTELTELMDRWPDRGFSTVYERELLVTVERKRALFSSWYERFPRSCTTDPERHGSFRDCIEMLPEIRRMGFDVLYLPPIHPIGETKRKGKNNNPESEPEDVGSPWAIGSREGGHTAIHPDLGTLEDFLDLVEAGKSQGIELALDLAYQCSPDHPYVKEHPEWFRWRPDGTVQYAENPPKKYEDVLPINFETDHWQPLWEELRDVVLFWIDKGIRVFRVDNPHTKPFVFWEWLLGEIRRDYPDVIFLSEAFARPTVMYRLAKIGFTQSYTYFTWRNTKWEFESYLTELTQGDKREYFRPNFWTNTPDILPEHLQYGGRPAFMMRLLLAATLSSSYGVYGPVFELAVSEAVPGKEEYKDSEKYEVRQWDWEQPGHLRDFIARVNRVRQENPAFQTTWNLRFVEVENEYLLAYIKYDESMESLLLVVVNLDPYHTQSGWLKVPIGELEIDPEKPYLVHDLLGDGKYIWHGERNYVELNPKVLPGHIFQVRKRLRRESDFDYFV